MKSSLYCKKCNSFWLIYEIFSERKMEYTLSCPFCGASGIYEIEEIDKHFIDNIRVDNFGSD